MGADSRASHDSFFWFSATMRVVTFAGADLALPEMQPVRGVRLRANSAEDGERGVVCREERRRRKRTRHRPLN